MKNIFVHFNVCSQFSYFYICRYIYWNSHFYGSNFYGWSIGDVKSLTESGPFHSQGITFAIKVSQLFFTSIFWIIQENRKKLYYEFLKTFWLF